MRRPSLRTAVELNKTATSSPAADATIMPVNDFAHVNQLFVVVSVLSDLST